MRAATALALIGAAVGVCAAAAPAGPAPSPAAVERGNAIYAQTCAACHGANGRGGPGGAADLTASTLALANDGGRGLVAFLAVGRPERGMPAHPVTEEEAANLSAKLRSLALAAAPGGQTGGGGSGAPVERVLVGDPAAGRAYFNGPVGRCATCHAVQDGATSAAENLAHIASKYPDPKTLQSNMVLTGRRFYWSPSNGKDVTATISWPDGRSVKGFLSSVSDFKVFVRDETGRESMFERKDGEPKVVLTDRMQAHLDLLRVYRDNDIHDLTAYLATLK